MDVLNCRIVLERFLVACSALDGHVLSGKLVSGAVVGKVCSGLPSVESVAALTIVRKLAGMNIPVARPALLQ